jgi:hypothetical protein
MSTLNDKQRKLIDYHLQMTLMEAAQSMKEKLKAHDTITFDSAEQMNEYNTFAIQYFYNLRVQAPDSINLINFKHTNDYDSAN